MELRLQSAAIARRHISDFKSRRLEGQHAQKRHRKAGILIGRKPKIIASVQRDLIIKLHFLGRHSARELDLCGIGRIV